MFEKILYPTDLSDASLGALEYVKHLKAAGTREVILLHVIHERVVEIVARYEIGRSDLGETESFAEAGRRLENERREAVETISDELKAYGYEVTTRIEKGNPVREILRVEKEEAVSGIVIGSHGKSNIEGMLIGSVSEKVIRRSKKPVLVIKR